MSIRCLQAFNERNKGKKRKNALGFDLMNFALKGIIIYLIAASFMIIFNALIGLENISLTAVQAIGLIGFITWIGINEILEVKK